MPLGITFLLLSLLGFPTDTPPKTHIAHQMQNTIELDGQLLESDWMQVTPATNFRQSEPEVDADPSFRSEIRILYSNDAIYIGAMLYDTKPEKIYRLLGRRDDTNNADWFYFAVDSYFDKKTAYVFGVNAAGVQMDGLMSNNTRRNNGVDPSWDAVWDVATHVSPEGWSVEMKIPYAMLRFADQPTQKWGINFRREIARLGEVNEWVYIPRETASRIGEFGVLEGIKNIKPRRNIQLAPYTLGKIYQYKEYDDAPITNERSLNFGADFKLGITSNITLDATVNPDFGQVEADPAELNLTTIETVFQEKRPFFTEGAQIFDLSYGGFEGGLIYTRRIGSSAPIIGASKLSGRMDNGFSFGALTAITGEDFGLERIYGATRIKQEIGEQSYVGAGFTFFDKNIIDDTKRSYVGALDWDFRLKDNAYQLFGHTSFSAISYPGLEEEDEKGATVAIRGGKVSGFTTWSGGAEVYTDQFNPNDVGRLRSRDYYQLFGGIRRLINNNESFGPFRRGSLSGFAWNDWDYTGNTSLGLGWFINSRFTLNNFWTLSFGSNASGVGGYDNRETRDIDMLYKDPFSTQASISIETDSRKSYNLETQVEYQIQQGGGNGYGIELDANLNVGTRLSLEGSVGYNISNNMVSWISNEVFSKINNQWHIALDEEEIGYAPDEFTTTDFHAFDDDNVLNNALTSFPTYEGTTDRYYVPIFGDRDRRSLEFTLRTNVTFTPKLSLQLYSQLFSTKGQNKNPRLLITPETFANFPEYPKRHDFNVSNFQSNVVLRWEYRPGSILYLVWTQARGADDFEDYFMPPSPSPYGVSTKDQLSDTFGLFPESVFLVKFNYLFLR